MIYCIKSKNVPNVYVGSMNIAVLIKKIIITRIFIVKCLLVNKEKLKAIYIKHRHYRQFYLIIMYISSMKHLKNSIKLLTYQNLFKLLYNLTCFRFWIWNLKQSIDKIMDSAQIHIYIYGKPVHVCLISI